MGKSLQTALKFKSKIGNLKSDREKRKGESEKTRKIYDKESYYVIIVLNESFIFLLQKNVAFVLSEIIKNRNEFLIKLRIMLKSFKPSIKQVANIYEVLLFLLIDCVNLDIFNDWENGWFEDFSIVLTT